MRDRLTKSDWIKHGLRTLADAGPSALKIGAMAIALEVSRGSFYWHFRDLADFRAQLLQAWQEIATDRVIEDLDSRAGDPGRLKDLTRRALSGMQPLDRAVRSWAVEDGAVAIIVAAVDVRRVARIAKLLVEAGVECERAGHRATFLYWAYLGQAVVMAPRHASLSETALDEISELLER